MGDAKKWTKMWIVTIGGKPVAGTVAYTRKAAYGNFIRGEECTQWEAYKRAGYAVERCAVSIERRPRHQTA